MCDYIYGISMILFLILILYLFIKYSDKIDTKGTLFFIVLIILLVFGAYSYLLRIDSYISIFSYVRIITIIGIIILVLLFWIQEKMKKKK